MPHRPVAAVGTPASAPVRTDPIETDRRAVVVLGEGDAQQISTGERRWSGQPLLQGPDLVGLEPHVLAAKADDAFGLAEQPLEFGRRDPLVAECDHPVERQDARGIEAVVKDLLARGEKI